jgi:hypothetical protein
MVVQSRPTNDESAGRPRHCFGAPEVDTFRIAIETLPTCARPLPNENRGAIFDMVTEISIRIARDLRQQYTLGYTPEKRHNSDAFRKIKVKVSAPGQGKMHVRTRPGYSKSGERQTPVQSRDPA